MTFVALWWFSDVGIWCLFYYDVCRQLWLLSQYSFFSQMVDVLLQLYPRVCCPALLPPRPLLCLAASSCPTLCHTRYSYFVYHLSYCLSWNKTSVSAIKKVYLTARRRFSGHSLWQGKLLPFWLMQVVWCLFFVWKLKIRSAPRWTTCVICFTLQRDIVRHRYF